MTANPQPNDATAMTSEQYGAASQRAQTPSAGPQPVDPRSLTGAAYQQGSQTPAAPARHPRREPAQTVQTPQRVVTTQPVAEYQPVPSLHGHGRARLGLTVGPDGRVKDIEVIDSISGEMGRLIGAVQSWRYKPATQNGVPVTSRFTVDINVD
jgi:TonB family protein